MATRRYGGDLVWVRADAAFGAGGRFGIIMPEPTYRDGDREVSDFTPCLLDCGDPRCREWPDVWAVPGTTRTQAMQHHLAGYYLLAMYHVSECEMSVLPIP